MTFWFLGFLLGFLLYTFVCWVWFLGVMQLAEHKNELHGPVMGLALLALGIGKALDFILNFFGSFYWFADYPHYEAGCWLFTDTLKFQKARGGKRGAEAAWICAEMLNRYDPKGTHC